ncbi:MgtC/SapB family protein [Trichlorobacter ammonificans]|uniref:Protein MgtC n=1 Tax=Trichlorobacter ammonificans TaxID=2916410 RepID=A0ABM9D6N6_9BACT|nr:MgtC/SapB family protein [Trichlorobacter ammonificans]CAH2030372.1 Protein MgtC [Trichlorobacter ammonificans]
MPFPSLDPEMLLRLVLAGFLGSLVGLEREIHGRPAGFRTHLLVALGAALFVLVSLEFYQRFGRSGLPGPPGVDPGRVAAQVVTGIGFLGAGAIIKEGATVRGLTTAACLWVAAAIGVACGVGMFSLAAATTVLALISLLALKKVEAAISKDTYLQVTVFATDRPGLLDSITRAVQECGAGLMEAATERDLVTGTIQHEFNVKLSGRNASCRLLDVLSAVEGVRRIAVR